MKTEYPFGRRWFAAMSPERRSAIASLGGKRAQLLGRAHQWTSEEAREAGKKGGTASHAARRKATDGAAA
jgi:uncharacterized protein